jgi:hypothetical protein
VFLNPTQIITVNIANNCQGLEDIKLGEVALPNTNVDIKKRARSGELIGVNFDINNIGVPGYAGINGSM